MAKIGTISVIPNEGPDTTSDVTPAPVAPSTPDYSSMSDDELLAKYNELSATKKTGIPGSDPAYGNVGGQAAQPDYSSMSDDELLAMHKNLSELTAGTEKTAQHMQDVALTGGEPSQGQALAASVANSASLNSARNIKALIDSYRYGTTFKDEYQREKNYDEALERLNPGTSTLGNVVGGLTTIPFLPGLGAAKTGVMASEAIPGIIKSAIPAAATSGLYGSIAGGLGEHSWEGAGTEGLVGAGTGAVLAPIINRALSTAASRQLYHPVDSSGNFTPIAQRAIQDAGIDVSSIPPPLKQQLITNFQDKGISTASAREAAAGEFGVSLTRAQTEANPQGIYRENKLAAPSGGDLEQFKKTQADTAQTGARDQILGPQLSQYGSEFEAPAETIKSVQAANVAAKAAKDAAYAHPDIDKGWFDANAIANVADNVDRRMAADPSITATVNDPTLTQTKAAIKTLQDFSALRQQSLFGANPNPKNIVAANMKYVEETRKMLGNLAQNAEPKSTDKRNVTRMLSHFDDEVDSLGNKSTFSGGPEAIKAMEDARAANRSYKQKFGVQGPRDPVGRVMRDIVDDNLSPKQLADHFFNTTTVGGLGTAAPLYQRISDALGANSPEMNSVKAMLKMKLLGPKPERFTDFPVQARQIATRIEEFLSKSGSDLAKVAFSPADRAELQRYASVLRNASRTGKADIASNQKGFADNLFNKTAKWVAAGTVLHFAGHGPVGGLLAAMTHQAVEKGTHAVEAAKLAKSVRTAIAGAPSVSAVPKVGFHNRPAAVTPGLIGPALGAAGTVGTGIYNQYGPTQARAKGGRIEANQLIHEAERANKSLGGALKPLMNQSDESIVQALRMAKG